MNEDERFADELKAIVNTVRAPASAHRAIDRAASRIAAASADGPSRRRWWLFAAAATSVAVALVLALAIGTAPATATELLTKAERAAVSASTGLQSYRGTIRGENWMSGSDGKRTAMPVSYEQRVAFGAPNRLRIDTTASDSAGGSGAQQLFFDGSAAWLYVPDAKVAQPVEPRTVLSQSPFAPSTFAGAIEGLSKAFTAKQLADDAVLGRPAHVLELTTKSPDLMGPIARMTIWLDAQTLLQLGADVRDAQGQLLMTWRFVRLELNVEIAASEFSFTPPPGVRVGQIVPPGATAGMRLQIWTRLASQSPFQLFRPSCGIDGLEESMPARDDRGVVILPFTANGAPIVVMAQGPSAAFPPAIGENVDIGDIKAIYRVVDGVQHIDFDRAGTHLHIQGPLPLGREPLYHLVISLVPVAKS